MILVLDDDRATNEWLSAVLEAEGYVCHRARNRQEAEVWLHRTAFDLALVDIYLGAENGVDCLRLIKTLQHINGQSVAVFWKNVDKQQKP